MNTIKDILKEINDKNEWDKLEKQYNLDFFYKKEEHSDFYLIKNKLVSLLEKDEWPKLDDAEFLYVSTRSEYLDDMRIINMYNKEGSDKAMYNKESYLKEIKEQDKSYYPDFTIKRTDIHPWNYDPEDYLGFLEDRRGYAIDFIAIDKLLVMPLSIPLPVLKNISTEVLLSGFLYDISFDGLETEEKEAKLLGIHDMVQEAKKNTEKRL